MTVQNYLSYFDEMMRPTIPMFRLVPDDKIDWKPSENSFTVGQLMAHMGISIEVYGKGLSSGDWGLVSMREIFIRNRHTPSLGVEESISLMEKNYAEFNRRMAALTEDEFDHGLVDSPQLGRVPRWRLAMLAVEHIVNHRAELFMYLKSLGVRVNTETLYKG
jgi:uncharacterized damage-inducible protein DinB